MVALGILVPSVSVRIAAVQQKKGALVVLLFFMNCIDRIFDSLVRGLPKPLPRRFAPELRSPTDWGPNPPDPLGRPSASVSYLYRTLTLPKAHFPPSMPVFVL